VGAALDDIRSGILAHAQNPDMGIDVFNREFRIHGDQSKSYVYSNHHHPYPHEFELDYTDIGCINHHAI